MAIVAPVPVSQAGSEAIGNLITAVLHSVYRFTSQDPLTAAAPERARASRLRIILGETRTVPLEIRLTSLLVVQPEIASAVMSARGMTLTGLHVGETMLIGFDGARRLTFVVQVIGRRRSTVAQVAAADIAAANPSAMSGTYAVSYAVPFAGAPAQLRQTFDLQKKLTGGRTFRFSSDIFKTMGQSSFAHNGLAGFGVGVNRMSMGIDGPDGSIDILDSQVNVSPLSFQGYMMRGLHIASANNSPLRGAEIFVGLARPSLSLFDLNRGRVLGIIKPLAQGKLWRVRAGVFSVSPGAEKDLDGKLSRGGTVWHLDGRYAPNSRLAAEAEVAYAKGGLSWRARLDLQLKNLAATGEILRFDRRSPLVSVGAQAGGREAETFSFQWRVGDRLNTSFSYNHSAIVPSANSFRATLDRTSLSASATYRITPSSRLGFRFIQQKVETGVPGGSSRFRLETRTVSISHDIRFNRSWTNHFEARLNSSREYRADAQTESGLNFREQLRLTFKGGSATGFVNYTRQNQSLAGLIVRNPGLLPSVLRPAFAADPARFLDTNRDSLTSLLPGIELPQTRGVEAGLRLQKAFSRVNFAGDIRYNSSQIFEREQRSLIASVDMNLQLDAANSVQVSGSRSFALSTPGRQSAFTVSYVHRFGAGSGGGMQFSRLFGLERGVIQGRVFIDLNGNGNDDPEEPGVAGMKIQIDGNRSATTDQRGSFRFQMNSGAYNVAFISDELGLRWRATTSTEQHVSLSARQTVNVSFGVSNYGSVQGRVFNNLSPKGEEEAGSRHGVAGVNVSLVRQDNAGSTRTVGVERNGDYRFSNLAPGSYAVEIDRASLPADFHVPAQTSWIVTIAPLQNVYLDLPLSAQRSISGVVFIDKDGDGKFDPDRDQPIEGARVIANKTEVITGSAGAYLLRNMPYRKIEVYVFAPWGARSAVSIVELGEGPTRRKGVNLVVTR